MFSAHENAKMLKGALWVRGIYDGTATDGDDIIWKTQELFDRYKAKYITAIARNIRGINTEELRDQLEHVNRAVHHKIGIRPTRWNTIAEDLGKIYAHSPSARKAINDPANIDIFARIYKESPRLHRGAWSTLRTFFLTGLPLIMVTHANEDWTFLKLRKSRIQNFFRHVEVVSELNHSKTLHDWQRAAEQANMHPQYSLAMGDSLSSDIQPAARAKYHSFIWTPSSWGRHTSKGKVPMGTIVLDGIKDVIPALMQLEDAVFDES